jgi:pimeloyl-ACP methyl ester carboxylesterase
VRSRRGSPGKRDLSGRARYLAAYDAALALWPVPHTSRYIATRWGSTHVIASGTPDAPPLVLLHAMNLGATMWFANAAALGAHYRVYALDTIGSAGKSVATRPLLSRADCAAWLGEVLDGLQLGRPHLLGHSHGGWLALNMALRAPARVKRLVLLAPAASLLPFAPAFYLRGIPAALIPLRSLIIGLMRWMAVEGYTVNPLLVEQFVLGMRHIPLRLWVWPTVFSDDELQQVRSPTMLLVGEHEVLYPPARAVARARRLMPDVEALLVPHAGHGLPLEQPGWVNERVLRFLASGQTGS